ncbi:MAG: VOC family protein [Calditrichaeota bacterium]|nr:MAG: VOC family protein [Calditrichota bacterium]
MKFGHIEIFTKDVQKAKEFYTKILGFKIVAEQSENLVWVATEGQEFLLRKGKNTSDSETYQTAKTGFVLYTENLTKTAESLKTNGLNFQGIDGSEKCLIFTDLDGNWFQLVNPNDHQKIAVRTLKAVVTLNLFKFPLKSSQLTSKEFYLFSEFLRELLL